MFRFRNGTNLCETVEDLPRLFNLPKIYADMETTGLYPYLGDRICGIAVKAPDSEAYYVPIRHSQGNNLPVEAVMEWWRQVLTTAGVWTNHNVKFDAHFSAADGVVFTGELDCTLQRAKVFDSDRMGHKLKPLVREWCDMPMAEETEVREFLKRIKSKCYADVPIDMLGPYANMDVVGNQALDEFLMANTPEGVARVIENERRFTPVLFDMESRGMKINRRETAVQLKQSIKDVMTLDEEISVETQREFVDHHNCLFDVFVNQMGLPVLDYNAKSGNAKFDSKTLEAYMIRPDVRDDPRKLDLTQKIMKRRKVGHYKGLFLEPYWQFMDEAHVIHPNYNQIIRTGRMSCSEPNFQQVNPPARELIIPRGAFMSCDASQIEFRLIVHYINDADAIAAYAEDPDTDFHSWVAEVCRTKRGPGKTMNFSMGYGAGMKKVVSQLAANPDIMKEIAEKLDVMEVPAEDRQRVFEELCVEHATVVYEAYHDRLPGIRRLSRKATQTAKRRGYVFNLYGRRRHLPPMGAHKGFNSAVQSLAMDIIKQKMINLSPRYNSQMRDWGIHIVANVHDEILFECEEPEVFYDPDVQRYIFTELEDPGCDLRVPIRWDMGISTENWKIASKDDDLKINRNSLFAAA